MQFCIENLKMKRKRTEHFLTFQSGDSNPRFSVIFPPMIWIFTEGEGDEIKSKQAAKRDTTLSVVLYSLEILSRFFKNSTFICKLIKENILKNKQITTISAFYFILILGFSTSSVQYCRWNQNSSKFLTRILSEKQLNLIKLGL